MQKKHFLSLLVALLGLLVVARPTFMLLTHDFKEGADNAYFIYKHVKKRKQDFDEAAAPVILQSLQRRIVKLPPVTPSLFIAAKTQPDTSEYSAAPALLSVLLSGTKTYLLTGKLSI